MHHYLDIEENEYIHIDPKFNYKFSAAEIIEKCIARTGERNIDDINIKLAGHDTVDICNQLMQDLEFMLKNNNKLKKKIKNIMPKLKYNNIYFFYQKNIS